MGKYLILKAGGGGIDPDDLTATAGDVIKGKIAGVAGQDDPVAGTLELTGTAAAGDVLSGKTYYTTNPKTKQTGTMVNRGAVSQALNAGGTYIIPGGFHNGSGKVIANSLASQTSANATAGQILSGQTAWVNGSKLTGSMPNRGAISQGLGINGTYTIPAGYHNGSGNVNQSIVVQGGSTTTPGTANKTIVAANRYVNGNIVVAGDPNLIASNIIRGKTIFGVAGTAIYAGDTPGYFLEPPKEYESLTGGWVRGDTGLNGSFQKGSTRYYLDGARSTDRSGNSYESSILTSKTIDASRYRYLYLDYEDLYYTIASGGPTFNGISVILSWRGASSSLTVTTVKKSGTLKVDVSNSTGAGNIFVKLYLSWPSNSYSPSSQSTAHIYLTIKAIRYDAMG